MPIGARTARSEERRVGKECRSRWSPYQPKKKSGVMGSITHTHEFASAAVDLILHARSIGLDADLFFQAEDGILDHCVTGVQTCALPISARARPRHLPRHRHLVARGRRPLARRDL